MSISEHPPLSGQPMRVRVVQRTRARARFATSVGAQQLRTRPLLAAAVVGLAGGAIGVAYLAVLRVLSDRLGPGQHGAVATSIVLIAVGAFVAIARRVLGPTGDVELLVDNIHLQGGPSGVRHLRAMVVVSLACVAGGGALGPEAPLVSTNGTLGGYLGQRLRLEPSQVRVLAITGMASGFAVLFGAPLGGALFALEILHRRGLQYHEALIPAVVGALTGLAVGSVALSLGLTPVWSFAPAGPLAPTDLLWAVAAGVVGALGARLFRTLSSVLCSAASRLPLDVRPILGGAILAGLGLLSPWALTYGETQLGELAGARLTVAALVAIAGLKLVATGVTMASGWKGGFIVPLFFVGAALGTAVHQAVPSADETVIVTALMVAWCVGVTKTPLGATVVVASMAGTSVLPTTLVAAIVALLLAGSVEVISSQRDRLDLTGAAIDDPEATHRRPSWTTGFEVNR